MDCKFIEAPQFYTLYSLMIVQGAVLVMIPKAPLIPIMYFSQVLNGMVLPIILFFMIHLINDPAIMGRLANGRLTNIFAWSAGIILSLVSIFAAVTALR